MNVSASVALDLVEGYILQYSTLFATILGHDDANSRSDKDYSETNS